MNQTEKRKKRTEIADEQCRSSQKRQHHILLHLHIIRNLPIQNPSPLAHQPQQPYHPNPTRKTKLTDPFASLVNVVFGNSYSPIPTLFAFIWILAAVGGASAGGLGGWMVDPLGGIFTAGGGGGCFEAGKLRKGDVTQRKIQVLR